MRILWLAKRYYTQKDALSERYGRVYELPARWAATGVVSRLELLDYRGGAARMFDDGPLGIASTPAWFPMHLRRLRKRVGAFRPDAIVASGDCFIGLFAWRLARGLEVPFVFDVYDDYRTFSGYRAFLGWDAYGFLMRRAHHAFYASRALSDTHSWAVPWQLVPNGIDPLRFRPMDMADARRQAGLDLDARWIGYFGGLDAERGIDDLVDAVGRLNARDSRVRLLVCGAPRPGLRLDTPWIRYDGQVPHDRIPLLVNACDVVALPYRRGPTIDMASSCKIAEYLSCERPVVATDTPNLRTNFPTQVDELGPALCRPSDPVDLARAIELQLAEPRLATPPREHTWEAIAARTLTALRTVVADPNRQRRAHQK